MQGKTVLKWVGGITVGLFINSLLNKGKKLVTASNLIFDFVGVQVVTISKLYITLRVSNPSANSVTFDWINVELYFNDINIGRIYFNDPTVIPRNSSKNYVYTAILYPNGQIEVITNMLTTKAKKGIFKMKGNVSVEGVVIPIEKSKQAW